MNLRYLLHTRSWKHRPLRKSNRPIIINIIACKYSYSIFVFRKQPPFTHRCCQFHIRKLFYRTPAAFSDDVNPIYTYTLIWKLNSLLDQFRLVVAIYSSRFLFRHNFFYICEPYMTNYIFSCARQKIFLKVRKT